MMPLPRAAKATGSNLAAVRRKAAPLRHSVLESLREAIVAGRLGSGARLVERDLVASLGVSRTVIREALRQLEADGLVETIPNRGPVVRSLTLAEAREIYQIRAVLEGLAAGLFARNASAAQQRRLAQALDATAEAYASGDPARIVRVKSRFYDALFEGAGSATLSEMIARLNARIWRWRALGLGHKDRSPSRSAEAVAGLQTLLAALVARDAAAAERIAREEVLKAADEVARILGGQASLPGEAAPVLASTTKCR